MTQQEANYIITYFSRFMTQKESEARQHHFFDTKLGQPNDFEKIEQYNTKKRLFNKKGWLSTDSEVLKLLTNGYDDFEMNVAKRIQKENKDEYIINYCPKCNAVTRTPYAKYCVKCGHSWHNEIGGEFKFHSSFRITNRPYFWLTGELTKGFIQKGYRLDFTGFQVNIISEIKQIEFALRTINGIRREYPALGIELDRQQETLIKKYVTTSAKTIMILKEENSPLI